MDRLLRSLSRISFRLLAFNALLVFLPAAGVLFLDTYEQDLLEAQERTMAQEGRLLAAAIEATGRFDADDVRRILVQLRQRHEARLRVVDRQGELLADSARLGPRREPDEGPAEPSTSQGERGLLYRLGSLPFRALRRVRMPAAPPVRDAYDGGDRLLGPEIRKALGGRYGATTRLIGDDSPAVILYCAIPVNDSGKVGGAVLVSQSTYRILRTLDAVRVDVFKVFLASLGLAVVLTLVMATTIARPLARLRRQAEAIMDRTGRLRGTFSPSGRRDEIGDLERALADLTRRLADHLAYTESFAADVSHEFKNPLASIRTATELALEADSADERRRFLTMIQSDVVRLERLLSGAREISRIDARLESEERLGVELAELVRGMVEGFRIRLRSSGPQLVLAVADHGLWVSASPERLAQVFDNIIANATSFSPAGGSVTITVHADGPSAVVTVADEGPGIPDEHLELIFARFFSYRPGDAAGGDHTGLGLAIVKAIVEGYGGSVSAANRPQGGAVFKIRLPRAKASAAPETASLSS